MKKTMAALFTLCAACHGHGGGFSHGGGGGGGSWGHSGSGGSGGSTSHWSAPAAPAGAPGYPHGSSSAGIESHGGSHEAAHVAGEIVEHLLNPPGLDTAIAIASSVPQSTPAGGSETPDEPSAPPVSQWWGFADQVVNAESCSTLSDLPLADAVLRPNTELTLYVQPPIPSTAKPVVQVSGPVRVSSPLFNGSSITLTGVGTLGAPAVVDVRDSTGRSLLNISIPTRNDALSCE